jgi:hypothetical protein
MNKMNRRMNKAKVRWQGMDWIGLREETSEAQETQTTRWGGVVAPKILFKIIHFFSLI